jgi:hypothetical protein
MACRLQGKGSGSGSQLGLDYLGEPLVQPYIAFRVCTGCTEKCEREEAIDWAVCERGFELYCSSIVARF